MSKKLIYVFDTNVILNDPYAIFTYDNSEIVIPQTVLTELDRLKTSRSDREVKFRGREFSRLLFELSSYGSLNEGIELENESVVRVVAFEPSNDLPETLNNKNADDRILGSTWLLKRANLMKKVILVTNDLNMLLKAQTLEIDVMQHEYRDKGIFQRFMERLGSKRYTLIWLLVPVVLASILVVLWLFQVPSPIPGQRNALTPISDPFQSYSTQEVSLGNQIQNDLDNAALWMELGRVQFEWAERYLQENKAGEARVKYQDALNSFQNVVKIEPLNLKARNNIGSTYFVLGDHELALAVFKQVIEDDNTFSDAYANIGYIFQRHGDQKGALGAYRKYLEVDPRGARASEAKNAIDEIENNIGSDAI